MSDSSRDAGSTKAGSDKKQPETVQLTAEELRTIAGGAGGTAPAPKTPTPTTPPGSIGIKPT